MRPRGARGLGVALALAAAAVGSPSLAHVGGGLVLLIERSLL